MERSCFSKVQSWAISAAATAASAPADIESLLLCRNNNMQMLAYRSDKNRYMQGVTNVRCMEQQVNVSL